MNNTMEAARGKWEGILVGAGVPEAFFNRKNQPCPLCGGRDRARYTDKDGNGMYICNQCGSGNGMHLYMAWTGKTFAEAANEIDAVVGQIKAAPTKTVDTEAKRKRLLKIRDESAAVVDGDPVDRYLKGRGLKRSPVLRCHRNLAYWEDGEIKGRYPAMLAPFMSAEGRPVTFHVTYLTEEGEKAPVANQKKIMPPIGEMAGGAIQLFPVTHVLGVAEGIETALAVSKANAIPVWATYSAAMMEKFIAPIDCIRIFGDNDKSFTGQKAAYTLANRLGGDVAVYMPKVMGTDFADEVNND
jgi:putative DNA primase/helicase